MTAKKVVTVVLGSFVAISLVVLVIQGRSAARADSGRADEDRGSAGYEDDARRLLPARRLPLCNLPEVGGVHVRIVAAVVRRRDP